MVEHKKTRLLEQKENLFATATAAGSKEGIPIEKGVVLNEPFLVEHEALFRKYAEFFSAYPDLLNNSSL